jgi:glycosyltransferase involved in cell wall biosynthesis
MEMSHLDNGAAVSVVIPVYNRVSYLERTIASVLSQTFTEWQLIIVDDGSSEDVSQVLDRFEDESMRLIRQENAGNAAARNKGIQQSSSKYVICLDSDDMWHPEMLAACLETMEAQSSVDVVYTQLQTIDAEGMPLGQPPGPRPHKGKMLDALLMGYSILPSSAFVRRSCFDRWGLFTPGLDDWDLWLRWATAGCKFYLLKRPLLMYRLHDQNLNLALASRRQTHIAILDKYYASPDVPNWALAKKELVYANQYFKFSEKAWRAGQGSDGVNMFIKAVQYYPDYLQNIEFYYRLACAHQPRPDTGTRKNLDLDKAERTLMRCLEGLFSQPSLSPQIHEQQQSAYAFAYLGLGRLAYSVPGDKTRARHYLGTSIRAWPAVGIHSDWGLWLFRSLLK